MKLRVEYSAQLRTAAGRAQDEIELPEGSSLAELLDHLAARLGEGGAAHLLAPGGRVHGSLLIVVNDVAIAADHTTAKRLKPGDVVMLLPPIAGG